VTSLEDRHPRGKWRRGAAAWLLAALAIALPLQVFAQAQQPAGAPQPDRSMRDRDFGVTARHLGLERHVAMLQWQRADGGYLRAWSEAPIDSAGFAPGHENPPFPLQGHRWLPASVSVEGRPLDPEVLAKLGEWRDFRPNFSALPGNLAATFQPEGDGLGSAENPLAPEVGDLRIRWRELVLPPLQGRVVLAQGRWRLAPDAVRAAALPAAPPARADGLTALPWLLAAVGGVLVAMLWLRRRQDKP